MTNKSKPATMTKGESPGCTLAPIHVIVCGTDPNSALGGIGVVISGFLAALESQNLSYEMLPTYRPGSFTGKWLPWLVALPRLATKVRSQNRQGFRTIIYSHAGAFPSMLRLFFITALGRLFGARTIIHSHSAKMVNYLECRVQRSLVELLFSPANVIFALTPWWRDRLDEAGISDTIEVIPNPLPPPLLNQALQPWKPTPHRDKTTVLTMTRLVPGKGVDIAIRAIAETPEDVQLIIAGDGSEKLLLKQLAKNLNVDHRVRFTGWVSGDEKNRLLDEADIFCLPTTYDVFPMSIVEALAFGVPVIAANWGGIPYLVENERVGLLTKPGAASDVAAAIIRLTNPDLRKKMSIKAKQHIISLCATEHVGAQLKKIIVSLT